MKALAGLFVSVIFLTASLRGQDFYDTAKVQIIELHFAQSNWDYMLDTAKAGQDGYLMASWAKINGQQFDSVGVKYKGSSSYDSSYKKNPMHIELNTFRNQSYQTYTDVKLGNGYADPSLIREVLSYNLLRNYMDCPRSNFAKLYVNGVYMGVYANDEAINKQFCREHFFDDKGTLVKCNPKLTPSPAVKSNLKYNTNSDSSWYQNYYEMKSDYGWKNLEALCDSVSNHPDNMNQTLDLDRALWMLAFNTLFVNLDSYNGAFAQNYYLYRTAQKRFVPIVWDLNMSFGGFPFLGNANTSLSGLSISGMQTMPANIHSGDAYWPLIKGIQSNARFRKMYNAHLKTMTEECFASNLYLNLYQAFYNLIDTSVQADTKKFYTTAQFQTALSSNHSVGSYSVPGIQTLASARSTFLLASADLSLSAPYISNVNPVQSPALNNPLTFTAQVSNANSNGVFLAYRFHLAESFVKTPMFDDGQHGDGAASDQVFGASLTFTANRMQYYLYAENASAGIFSPVRAEHEFYEVTAIPRAQPGQVSINEFLADNKSDVRNEYNMHADWIELYNTSNQVLSLDDYYLSNSYSDRVKFRFPSSATIAPHAFLPVWADEILQGGNQFHANFKLNNHGDQIIFGDGLKTVLDSLSFGEQQADESFGRCPDGFGTFRVLAYPSYGMSNCIVGLEELAGSGSGLKVYPNPARSDITIQSYGQAEKDLIILDQTGRLILTTRFSGYMNLDVSEWSDGLYLLSCGSQHSKLILIR
ncbi:MAG TPA: CotH kinase family protein [Bacteroidia bacterium]|nr:CotH kinase family protein [Bacteroidia bacterium]